MRQKPIINSENRAVIVISIIEINVIAAQSAIYMEIICRFVSFVHLTMRNI